MKRFFKATSSILLILLIIGTGCYVEMEWILSKILSSKFGTTVSIEDVAFKEMQDIDVQKLSVSNPKQFRAPFALEVGSINISTPYANYLKRVISINSIKLTNIVLTVDFDKNVTNWEVLMKSLDDNDTLKTSSSYAVINTLSFNNLTVRISKGNGRFETHTISNITLHNVKTKKGELTRRVTQAILSEAIYNIQSIIKIPLRITEDTVDSTLDTFDFLNPFSAPPKKGN